MALSTVMAYVLDNEPVPGIGTSMNTGGPNLGLGVLGTGLLLAYVGFTGADAFLGILGNAKGLFDSSPFGIIFKSNAFK